MTPVRLIIFDCDGTLVDTERLHIELQRAHLAELGVEISEAYYREHFLGLRYSATLEKLAASHGLQVPEDFTAKYSAIFKAALAEADISIPGAKDCVVALARDYKICVASNGSHATTCHKLDRVGMMPPLTPEQVFSGMDVPAAKPAPDVFLRAMQAMGERDPAACLVVEDSLTGLKGATAASMPVALLRDPSMQSVPAAFEGKYRAINSLADLLN